LIPKDKRVFRPDGSGMAGFMGRHPREVNGGRAVKLAIRLFPRRRIG
jgi:hypothetical protein